MDYHYDVTLVVDSSGEPVGQGVSLTFRESPTGADVPVSDYVGNSLTLTTSRLSCLPRFVATAPTGYLATSSGAIVLPAFSAEAANAISTVQQFMSSVAQLSGATFAGPVNVPTPTAPDNAATKAYVDEATFRLG